MINGKHHLERINWYLHRSQLRSGGSKKKYNNPGVVHVFCQKADKKYHLHEMAKVGVDVLMTCSSYALCVLGSYEALYKVFDSFINFLITSRNDIANVLSQLYQDVKIQR